LGWEDGITGLELCPPAFVHYPLRGLYSALLSIATMKRFPMNSQKPVRDSEVNLGVSFSYVNPFRKLSTYVLSNLRASAENEGQSAERIFLEKMETRRPHCWWLTIHR
jgi:hypothetical protein